MDNDEHENPEPSSAQDAPSEAQTWRRKAIGLGAAAAVVSAILAVTANLSEIASLVKPDETRELVEETRGFIVGTDEKIEELVALLRNQAAASGVDLNIESEVAIRNAITAIIASGNARKQSALKQLDEGDVVGAAEMMAGVAANQADAATESSAAAAESWREAGAIYYPFDVVQAIRCYREADRLQPDHPKTLEMLGHSFVRAGRFNDAETVFNRSLAIDAPPAEASSAHFGLGHVAKKRGRYVEAGEHYQSALDIAGRHRLGPERIYALIALGQLDRSRGDVDGARARLEQALSQAEEIGDEGLQAKALDTMGTIAAQEARYDDAERLMNRALEIHTARNDKAGQATTLGNLGAMALSRGDFADAEQRLLRAVSLGEELGSDPSVAYDLVNLASIAVEADDFDTADERLGRAQLIADEAGLDELAPVIVFNRGDIARDSGDMGAACGYWLEALPALEAMGSVHVATARRQIDDAACESLPPR